MNDVTAPASEPALFDRRDPVWRRVSSKHAVIDLITNLIWMLPPAAAAIVMLMNDAPLGLTLGAAGLALFLVINAVFAFRRVKAIGYVLREDDFVFRRGIMFERIVAVPYGRLQLVDVTAGPLQRAFGLASLKFVTASTATAISLPGLLKDDAAHLRDELISLAETRRSGL